MTRTHRWQNYYRDNRLFVLERKPDSDNPDHLSIETDDRGVPYLRVSLATSEDETDVFPIGHLLLLVHDIGTGLAYDLGRGLALRATPDSKLIWRIGVGNVITLLRSGETGRVEAAYGTGSGEEGKAIDIDFDRPAEYPGPMILPTVARRGIAWVLGRACPGRQPRMGLLPQRNSEAVTLCFSPAPGSPALAEWAHWRFGWYLPSGSPYFALTDHEPHSPFPMRE